MVVNRRASISNGTSAPATAAANQLASSNATSNLFLGGRQPSWLQSAPALQQASLLPKAKPQPPSRRKPTATMMVNAQINGSPDVRQASSSSASPRIANCTAAAA